MRLRLSPQSNQLKDPMKIDKPPASMRLRLSPQSNGPQGAQRPEGRAGFNEAAAFAAEQPLSILVRRFCIQLLQ